MYTVFVSFVVHIGYDEDIAWVKNLFGWPRLMAPQLRYGRLNEAFMRDDQARVANFQLRQETHVQRHSEHVPPVEEVGFIWLPILFDLGTYGAQKLPFIHPLGTKIRQPKDIFFWLFRSKKSDCVQRTFEIECAAKRKGLIFKDSLVPDRRHFLGVREYEGSLQIPSPSEVGPKGRRQKDLRVGHWFFPCTSLRRFPRLISSCSCDLRESNAPLIHYSSIIYL